MGGGSSLRLLRTGLLRMELGADRRDVDRYAVVQGKVECRNHGGACVKVLVACEFSGVVRDAFRRRGHDAWSCDLLPSEADEKWHLVGDIFDCIEKPTFGEPWDLMIAHPPCTYLCNSGVLRLYQGGKKINGRDGWRWREMQRAAQFFVDLLNAPIGRICIENPVMHGYARELVGTNYTQRIQPYHFREDASKGTCLWLKNLPPLRETGYVRPRLVNGLPRWANQTDSNQTRLGPSPDRWKIRSRTYQGIADAMAEQWGSL